MKKSLKAAAAAAGCLIVLTAALNFAMKSKIDEIIKREGGKTIRTAFDYEDIDVSLIKSFPHISVTLKNLTVNGTDESENEPLIKAEKLTAAVNAAFLFGGDYEISKILLENAYLKAVKLQDGTTNWDILKKEYDIPAKERSIIDEKETKEPKSSAPFNISLKNAVIKNVNAAYDDRKNGLYAEIQNAGLHLSESAGKDQAKLETSAKAVTLRIKETDLFKNASLSAMLNINADYKNKKFIVNKSAGSINDIKVKINGQAVFSEIGPDMEIKIESDDTGLKELLSLIPANHIKNADKISAKGRAAFSISVKGLPKNGLTPSFNASLAVKDASLHYAGMPSSLDHINITASASSPGGSLDNISAEISGASFNLAEKTVTASASVKTPASDPDFSVSLNGTIDMGKVKDVCPIDNVTLTGIFKADVNASGKRSYIDNRLYDKLDIKGYVQLEKAAAAIDGTPEIKTEKSVFSFAPEYLSLTAENVSIGKNDLSAVCVFENYIGFALNGETIKGSLKINSGYFDLNDFIKTGKIQKEYEPEAPEKGLSAPSEPEKLPAEKAPLIDIPENIDFTVDADMKKVLFGNMTFENFKGRLKIKNGETDMENISFDTMGGSVGLGGVYSARENAENPKLRASLDVKNISFQKAHEGLNIIRRMAPVFADIEGTFSGDIHLNAEVDKKISLIPDTLNGNGTLKAYEIRIGGIKALDGIADILKNEELRNIKAKDIKVSFGIKDGRVTTMPFDIKTNGAVIKLAGSSGLDQTLDYSGKIDFLYPGIKETKLARMDIKIGGTFASPEISINTRSMINQALDAARDKAYEELRKRGADPDDAAKLGKELIDSARKAGSRLIDEIKKQFEKLEEKTGNNPYMKIYAEKNGEKLIKNSENQTEMLTETVMKTCGKLINKIKNRL